MITALFAAGPQHWQGGGGGFFPCLLFGLLLIGLLALAAFWWFRRRPDAPGASGGSSAEDILAERYAKGEMSDDEYLQRQSVLRDNQNRKRR